MLMKRVYKKPEGWEKEVDENGNCTNPPPLDYLSLAHTGIEPEQNFSTQMVTGLLTDGLVTIEGDVLTLNVEPEPLIYKIVRQPGRYCLHCGEKLADDQTGALARLHIAMQHNGVASPDPSNPSGYVALNHFACVLDSAQHEKFRAKGVARAPVFHVRKADVEKH